MIRTGCTLRSLFGRPLSVYGKYETARPLWSLALSGRRTPRSVHCDYEAEEDKKPRARPPSERPKVSEPGCRVPARTQLYTITTITGPRSHPDVVPARRMPCVELTLLCASSANPAASTRTIHPALDSPGDHIVFLLVCAPPEYTWSEHPRLRPCSGRALDLCGPAPKAQLWS